MVKCSAACLGFLPGTLLTLDYGPAETKQAKASDADIRLAWERIETFLWKHVGPASSAHSTDHTTLHQQSQDQVPSTAIRPLSEAADASEAAHVSSTDGIEGVPNIRTPSSEHNNAGA